MNKKTKIIFALIICVSSFAMIITPVLASVDLTWNDVTIEADSTNATAVTTKDIAGQILGVIQIIGVAVAVIMLIVLAIKYISAAPNDKAEIKKHAVVYVVGAVVLFAASGIIGLIRNFAEGVNNEVQNSLTANP